MIKNILSKKPDWKLILSSSKEKKLLHMEQNYRNTANVSHLLDKSMEEYINNQRKYEKKHPEDLQ